MTPIVDRAAAELALLAISTGTVSAAGARCYRTMPGTGIRSREEVIDSLTRATKPVLCMARVSVDRCLEIECTSLAADSTKPEIRSAVLEYARSRVADRNAREILVRGVADAILVSLNVLETWLEDYRIAPPISLAGVESVEQSPVACVVQVFSAAQDIATTSVDDLDIPADLREIIRGEFEKATRAADPHRRGEK